MSRATRASRAPGAQRPSLRERMAPRLARAEAAVFRGAMNLPEGLQRRLAGRPVVREGQTLAVDTQLMLRLQRVARKAAAETLDVPAGRLAILEQSALAGGRQPIGSVQDVKVGPLPGRFYTPTSHRPGAPSPLLVFFHGGGFIYGDLDSHDAPCRFLAERSGVRVLAVDYRLAPEEPFPAAYDDCVAAFRWVVENVDEFDADPARLAVGGDSAGGNLAAGVAIAAAREGLPLAFQLLVYPMTDARGQAASRQAFGAGFFLTSEFIDLASTSYTPDAAAHTDPRVSPLLAQIPPGLAPAYLCTAGFDPLRDEGEAYARKLADSGVAIEMQRFPDQIHGFFNIVGAGRTARAANAVIAAKLKAALRP